MVLYLVAENGKSDVCLNIRLGKEASRFLCSCFNKKNPHDAIETIIRNNYDRQDNFSIHFNQASDNTEDIISMNMEISRLILAEIDQDSHRQLNDDAKIITNLIHRWVHLSRQYEYSDPAYNISVTHIPSI